MNNFKVLAISYGRNLFDKNNAERKRMEACARTVSEYHMIVFTNAKDKLETVTTPNGLYIHPTNSKSKLTMVFDAIRIGKQILSDVSESYVITAQDPFEAGLVGYSLAKKFDIPLNVQEHGDFFSTPYWRRDTWLNRPRFILGKWLLRRATLVRVVSERIKKTMIRIGVNDKRIITLPVRSDQVSKDEGGFFDYGFSDDSIVILTMARLVRQKNLPLLIESFKAVYKVNSKVRLVIVGSGPEEAKLKSLVNHNNLTNVVTFIPWTDDPASHMRAADVYALSSDWEGWARVLMEAVAYGIPTITTDVGCVNETFIDGTHGFIVPVGDQAEFTSKLSELVANETLRKKIAESKTNSVENYSNTLEDYAQEWVSVLEQTKNLKNTQS